MASTDHSQDPRRPHDFLDDLESFLWVYVWFTMVQDGPGEAAFLSKPCPFIRGLLKYEDDLGHLRRIKYLYMRNTTGRGEVILTPYFSQSPYLELTDNLRQLLEGYRHPKQNGEDLFPEMEGIYSRYLAYFDSAIEQLGGTADPVDPPSHLGVGIAPAQQEHKLPFSGLRRIQPDRRAKRVRQDEIVATRETKKARVVKPPPARPAKRVRDDDPVSTRKPKKRKIAPQTKDVKSSSSKLACRSQEGTRRSERIRNGKARDALTGANGDRRTTGSKRT